MIKIKVDNTDKSSDWIKAVTPKVKGRGVVTKFEIPDELLEAIDIDPKKMSPDQIKAMFAKLKDKGLLNDKPADKKSTGKESGTKEPDGAQGSGKPGLVKKKVTVHRGGKTFEQERWVKAGEDEPAEKPKKGEDEPGEKPGEKPEPEKPKGPVILGTNKPEGEDGESEDVKGKETTTEDKPEKVEVSESKEDKHDNVISKLKPGMTITVMKNDKVVKEIDNKNELVICDDGSIFTFGAVNKFGEIKEVGKEEPKKSEKPKPFDMSKDNLSNLQDGEEVGLPDSVHSYGIFIAEYKDGNKGIYKVTESPLDVKGELAYHDLAEEIGWDMVPQAEQHALHDDEGYSGTCHAFVEGKEPYDQFITGGDNMKITEKHFNDVAQIFVMDAIVGNPDRHCQNVKVNDDGRVWAIDNDTWTENTPAGYQQVTIDDKFDTLLKYAGGKSPPYKNKMYDWLTRSLNEEDFKKFKGVVDEKLTEIMTHKDKICGFYETEEGPWGSAQKGEAIGKNIEFAEKYLSEQKK